MTAETLLPGGPQAQRMLRLYHLYRLVVGITLVLLISSDMDDRLLELANGQWFRIGSWAYLIVNILVVVLGDSLRQRGQVFGVALIDIVMLSGIFYTGGGTASGIGNLMVASVAMSNLLLRGRAGLMIAALASIGIIYLTFYLNFSHPASVSNYVQASTLGILCFAVALLVQALTRLLRVSENRAEQNASAVTNLEELNALILQRMRTGILVLDSMHRVLLANEGALKLIGRYNLTGKLITAYSSDLLERLRQWQNNPTRRLPSLKFSATGPSVQASFIALSRGNQQHILVFLEDISEIAQQAQQLKLAALGRLTASIAHEIRNPLGAISHAGQLLQESEALDSADRRLTQIIQDQSKRMNLIIENVLQLSRRRASAPQLLDLKVFLENFLVDFRSSVRPREELHLHLGDGPCQTHMDPHQLTQVLSNLVENALRYSAYSHGRAQAWLNLFVDSSNGLPTLDVLDDGPGVTPDQRQHLFEPFFTTEAKGTGLGLYISRELCESNQAHLDYTPRERGGSCLRITFAHVRRLS